MTPLTLGEGARPRLSARHAQLLVALLLVFAMLASSGVGAVSVSPWDALRAGLSWFGVEVQGLDEANVAVLMSIRLPRVVLAALVGAALATSGAVLQGLFRNPLADPALLGVTTGAALAVAIALVGFAALSLTAPLWALPAAAFLGGIATTVVVAAVASRGGRTSVSTLLLGGVALNAITGAGLGYVIYAARDAELRDLTFWTLGSLGGATWPRVVARLPFFAVAFFGLFRLGRPLNALVLGEGAALHLGIDVEKVKRRAVVAVALAVGAAVSLTGSINFVGLVVPHLWRLLFGPDHRGLLTGSALLGALLLVLADLVSRVVVAPSELPVGVVTATLGAPFFLWLLWRERARELS